MKVNVKIVNKSDNLRPIYEHRGDSGVDIRAFIQEPVAIKPNETKLIPTGIKCVIPEGYEIQVRSRSGLCYKHGIVVFNSPGTVDSNYRGDIGVILHNTSNKDFVVQSGDRIAQIVLQQVPTIEWEVINESQLNTSNRGENGFGSSGIK